MVSIGNIPTVQVTACQPGRPSAADPTPPVNPGSRRTGPTIVEPAAAETTPRQPTHETPNNLCPAGRTGPNRPHSAENASGSRRAGLF